jgi:hypothetical protein
LDIIKNKKYLKVIIVLVLFYFFLSSFITHLTVSQIIFSSLNARSSSGGTVTASKILSLEAKKNFESFEVMDASVQQKAGTQSSFFSPSKVVFYRYYAIYELSLRAAVIKVISFHPENSGASITIIGVYVGQVPRPEFPYIVSFTYSLIYNVTTDGVKLIKAG